MQFTNVMLPLAGGVSSSRRLGSLLTASGLGCMGASVPLGESYHNPDTDDEPNDWSQHNGHVGLTDMSGGPQALEELGDEESSIGARQRERDSKNGNEESTNQVQAA